MTFDGGDAAPIFVTKYVKLNEVRSNFISFRFTYFVTHIEAAGHSHFLQFSRLGRHFIQRFR